jgi:hypothetical protein
MSRQSQWLFEAPPFTEGDLQFVANETITNLLLTNAVEDSRLNKAGVYRITWQQGGKTHVYDGKAGGGKQTVRKRLRQHLSCITRFGGDSSKYRVSVQLMAPGASPKYPAKLNKKGQKDLTAQEQKRIGESKTKHKQRRIVSHNRERESEFLFKTGSSCSTRGLSDADCSHITSLPVSGCCRSGFLNTCYSHTFIPRTSSRLNIRVNVDYVSPPASWVSSKEDFSVQVRKCGMVWDTDIGSKRVSSLGLPNTLSFAIASVTPGEKYYIKIYSRSSLPLVADYQIWQ